EAMMRPRAVAVVGASSDPTRIGGRPIAFMQRFGFAGEILPVNPRRDEIQGLKAHPTLSALDREIDLAILATPASDVPQALEDAADRGARAAVIFSSGFAEVGPDGAAMQDRIARIAEARGLAVVGPNSLGTYDAGGATAAFASFLDLAPPRPGPLAILSQSGAYGAHVALLAAERGVAASRWIATGNEASLGATEFIDHFADDPELRVLGVYSEGVRDGRVFCAAVRRARDNGKSVVLMKVGRTAAGEAAAASHTASLAGDDAVFDAAAAEAGALRADRTDHFIDLLYGLARKGPIRGRKLGVVTISGGAGVLMADAATDAGLTLPPMPEASQARLKARCPFGAPVNPVDITAQAINDMGLVTEHLKAMFAEGGYDAVGGFFLNWARNPVLGPKMAEAIAEGVAGFEDRVLALSGVFPPEAAAPYEAAGALIFEDPTACINAVAAMARAGEAPPRDLPALPPADDAPLGSLDEAACKALLGDAGVPMAPERVCASPEEVGQAAAAFDGPVALKILSPDLAHKTEVGGVRLGVPAAEAEAAARAMDAAVAAAAPEARRAGFLVAPMLSGVAELIVGARVDPVFGPVVLVGLGGVFAEVMADTALRLAPVDAATAETMIRSLKGFALLDGARGRPKADVAAAAEAVAALSRFAAARRGTVASVEVNPLLVRERGAVALDAAIAPADGA
ncbi:MAG: acetate--CoA ligase family protein, partial [Pseudomonadota bacterium]